MPGSEKRHDNSHDYPKHRIRLIVVMGADLSEMTGIQKKPKAHH
jgi:hypothetical protein